MPSARLAIVSDLHYGRDNMTKKGSEAPRLMEEFRRFVREARPDAVIELGDRITDDSHDVDLGLERSVAEMFAAVEQPVFHICGNHDRDYISVAENEAILGQSLDHQLVDLGDWQVFLWRADSKIHRPGGFILNEADLLALARVVGAATKPTAIMSHVPISGHSQIGNYYFEANPNSSTYYGVERARAVLRTARVPVVWISGHVHWNTLTTVDGIPHVTLQSLTETFTTFPEPAGCFGLLELSDRILWRVHGLDTFGFDIAAADTTRRWMTPLQPFADIPENRLRRLQQEAAKG